MPTRDDRSHIKCSRAQDGEGNTMAVLRLGLPFGQSDAVRNIDLSRKGASLRDEEGVVFAGYARSAEALESIVANQIGGGEGPIRDRLLANVHADAGGLFYIPSQADLGLPEVDVPDIADLEWSRFPGVDWDRLDRHFTQRSKNGLMYYNHKDYLFQMATMPEQDKAFKRPPSARVQLLLANAFMRWQDNWYFDRKQQGLGHLRDWVAKKFGAAKVEDVMALP
ncbi:formate acetyltransferase, partial [Pseudomonas sp. MWU13-2860]